MENICTTHSTVIVFRNRDIMGLNDIFPLAGLIKAIVYLQICQRISKQVFHRTEILFFVLTPSYDYFGVTYVSRSIELNLCPSESY